MTGEDCVLSVKNSTKLFSSRLQEEELSSSKPHKQT